jgi:hypothetical protein
MLVLMQDSSESVSSVDFQVSDLCWHVDQFGQWAKWRGALQLSPLRDMIEEAHRALERDLLEGDKKADESAEKPAEAPAELA